MARKEYRCQSKSGVMSIGSGTKATVGAGGQTMGSSTKADASGSSAKTRGSG